MDFIVTMRPHPGDQVISVAEIRMYDASGMQMEGQFLLEAETAETRLSMPPGGHMKITEHERRDVFDAEQKAAVPIGTAERESNIDSPNTPQPKTEREMRKHEEEFAKKHEKTVEEKKRQDEAERKKSGWDDPKVDAKDLRMKEEEDRKRRQEEAARHPVKTDTAKPDETKLADKSASGTHADLSKGIDTSGSTKSDDKSDPTKRK